MIMKTNKEWTKFCNGEIPEKGTLPNDIPKAPGSKYKGDGFTWGDFLGTSSISSSKRNWRPLRPCPIKPHPGVLYLWD